MSVTPQGEGWWQASHRLWYPPHLQPEVATDPLEQPLPPIGQPGGSAVATGAPPGLPGSGAPPLGASYSPPLGYGPPPGYGPQPGYGPPPGYGYRPPGHTNTLAIVALILAFVFWPAGIVCGHLARSQIRRTGEDGLGLTTAALIVGYVYGAFLLIVIVIAIPTFLSVKTAARNTASQADLTNTMTSATAIYARTQAFPSTDAALIRELESTQGEFITFVPGTTSPLAGKNSVSVYAGATGAVMIVSAVDPDAVCWAGSVNEGSTTVDGIPPGDSVAGDSTGRCTAAHFASSTTRWLPNFRTLPTD